MVGTCIPGLHTRSPAPPASASTDEHPVREGRTRKKPVPCGTEHSHLSSPRGPPRHPGPLSQRSTCSFFFISSTSAEKTADSSGSSKAQNPSLACSCTILTSCSPYFWSSFRRARVARFHRSERVLTPMRLLSIVRPIECLQCHLPRESGHSAAPFRPSFGYRLRGKVKDPVRPFWQECERCCQRQAHTGLPSRPGLLI